MPLSNSLKAVIFHVSPDNQASYDLQYWKGQRRLAFCPSGAIMQPRKAELVSCIMSS